MIVGRNDEVFSVRSKPLLKATQSSEIRHRLENMNSRFDVELECEQLRSLRSYRTAMTRRGRHDGA